MENKKELEETNKDEKIEENASTKINKKRRKRRSKKEIANKNLESNNEVKDNTTKMEIDDVVITEKSKEVKNETKTCDKKEQPYEVKLKEEVLKTEVKPYLKVSDDANKGETDKEIQVKIKKGRGRPKKNINITNAISIDKAITEIKIKKQFVNLSEKENSKEIPLKEPLSSTSVKIDKKEVKRKKIEQAKGNNMEMLFKKLDKAASRKVAGRK